jgi:hypothetical protein
MLNEDQVLAAIYSTMGRAEAKAFDGLTKEMKRPFYALFDHLIDCGKELERREPIDMILHCPDCTRQHIDLPQPERRVTSLSGKPEKTLPAWPNPPHRTHQCQHCGCEWRPSHHATNGVASLPLKK